MISNMDQETKEKLAEIESVKHTLDTPGWGVIEARINGMVEDLCNIRRTNFEDGITLEERLKQLEIREGAAELVEKWLGVIKSDAEWAKPLKSEDTLSDTIYTTS